MPNLKKNSRGFTLVEILIGLGLLAGAGMLLGNLLLQGAKGQKKVSSSFDFTSKMWEVFDVLQSSEYCTASKNRTFYEMSSTGALTNAQLSSEDVPATNTVNWIGYQVGSGASAQNVKVLAEGDVLENTLTVSEITFERQKDTAGAVIKAQGNTPAIGKTTHKVNLVITAKPISGAGNPITKTFKLTLVTDTPTTSPTNSVSACAAPAATSQDSSTCKSDCYFEGTHPNFAQGLPIGTERQGPQGSTLTLQYANGASGFKIWKEKNGSRILNATGLIANGWQKKLTRAGTGFTTNDFTTSSQIGGRACPIHVFLSHTNMNATGRCLYYDTGNPAQRLNKDSGTEAEDWLVEPTRANTGRGVRYSWYEGNIKTCADKGMRLPTAYETNMPSTWGNGEGTVEGNACRGGGALLGMDVDFYQQNDFFFPGILGGVPSVPNTYTWTATAYLNGFGDTYGFNYFFAWNVGLVRCCYFSSSPTCVNPDTITVRCVLP